MRRYHNICLTSTPEIRASSLYFTLIHAWIIIVSGLIIMIKIVPLFIIKVSALLGFGLCPKKYLAFDKKIV